MELGQPGWVLSAPLWIWVSEEQQNETRDFSAAVMRWGDVHCVNGSRYRERVGWESQRECGRTPAGCLSPGPQRGRDKMCKKLERELGDVVGVIRLPSFVRERGQEDIWWKSLSPQFTPLIGSSWVFTQVFFEVNPVSPGNGPSLVHLSCSVAGWGHFPGSLA